MAERTIAPPPTLLCTKRGRYTFRNRMDSRELTALRYATDSMAASPSDWRDVLAVVQEDQETSASVKEALEVIAARIESIRSSNSIARLFEAAESLRRAKAKTIEREAGIALYAALVDHGFSKDERRAISVTPAKGAQL